MLQEYYGQKNLFINLKSIQGINLIALGLEKYTKPYSYGGRQP